MDSPTTNVTYELTEGVKLLRDHRSGILLRPFPLSLVRLNTAAFELVERCHSGLSLREAASNMDCSTAAKLLAHLERRGFVRAKALPQAYELPSVSVVVPVRNRAEQIRKCVESLLALEYPKDKLEIIVVDDASEDDTPAVIAELPVRLIPSPTHLRAAGCRNLGWQAARGEVIAFTDSDCLVDSRWLWELVGKLREPGVGAVGGMVGSSGTGSKLERYEASYSPLYSGELERDVNGESGLSYLPTCNLLIKRSVLQEIGGFDPSFFPVGEDVDLVWRILDAGHRVLYVPRGRVIHHHRESVAPFAVRRCEYAASEAQLLKKHPNRRRAMMVPTPQLATLSLLGVGVLTGWSAALLMAIAVVATQSTLMWRRLANASRLVGVRGLALSLVRGYLGFGQLLLWTLSQYYLLPLVVVVSPLVMLGVLPLSVVLGGSAAILTAAAILSFLVSRPGLTLLDFVPIYCLDKLSFQVGVLRGCLTQRTLRPLLPNIVVLNP